MYSFEYHRPADQAAAVAALQGDSRYLAGGQSLIQAMRLRLSSSERLVDLGAVAEIKGIKVDGNNLMIGAMTTHASVARSARTRIARRERVRSRCNMAGPSTLTAIPPFRSRTSRNTSDRRLTSPLNCANSASGKMSPSIRSWSRRGGSRTGPSSSRSRLPFHSRCHT